MTVLATGDIRGFYESLGVMLPDHAAPEAAVKCFASPESHRHGDRSPSASISLVNGAWCCHACGARGGAYDAALARGHTPRGAIELMIRHGLIERRPGPESPSPNRVQSVNARPHAQPPPAPQRPRHEATDADVARWQSSLSRRPSLILRLAHEREWRYGVMCQLEVGLDASGRLTIPIRTATGDLQGVLRYQPWRTHGPKMLAVRGTRLGLIPHPAREPAPHVILVEGPADMIAARSNGLAAIAVSGTYAWRSEWAPAFAARHVTVVMDCDGPGREAANRIASDLAPSSDVTVLDLDPARADGYDLTDTLLDRERRSVDLPALTRLERGLARSRFSDARGLER
jgi:Toprim-like